MKNYKKTKLSILCLILGHFTVVFSQKRVEIPFTLDGHLMLIYCKLDSKSAKSQTFIYDTGTPGVYLYDSLAIKNNYKAIGKIRERGIEGNDMGDRALVQLNKMYIENLTIKPKAVLMPKHEIFSEKAVGIIGLSTFDGYVITIDYSNKKLILTKGNLKKDKNKISLNTSEILEANISINGKNIPAHFDCGAPSYISIPKAIQLKYDLKTQGEPRLIGKARTPGGEFEVYTSKLNGTINIGKIQINNPAINIVTANFPAINIGYWFFVKHLVSIDYKNKLMKIVEKI